MTSMSSHVPIRRVMGLLSSRFARFITFSIPWRFAAGSYRDREFTWKVTSLKSRYIQPDNILKALIFRGKCIAVLLAQRCDPDIILLDGPP